MSTEKDFEIDWSNGRELATARITFGDLEVSAHCHIRKGRPVTDSISFQRNSGYDDRPFIDFWTHLPAGGYRRLAAMLNALADAVGAEAPTAETYRDGLRIDPPKPEVAPF